MANTNEHHSEPPNAGGLASASATANDAKQGSPTAFSHESRPGEAMVSSTPGPSAVTAKPAGASPPARRQRKGRSLAGAVVGLAVIGYWLAPWLVTMLNTVSTDDAYVNGHVTLVAPRVAGEVSRVLVDDNYRVKKGDLLVRLDKEPFQIQ